MKWKDFLYFQKGEKLAVILLLILIVLTMVLNALLSRKNASDIVLSQNDSLVREFAEFQRSLKEKMVVPSDDNTRSQNDRDNTERRTYAGRPIDRNAGNSSGNVNRSLGYTPFPTTEKLSKNETISLNETDTSEWKKLPGIGSVYASRIVKYRNLLGGFASVEQLREVYGISNELYAQISPYISEDDHFQRIEINKRSLDELRTHPYINYKQAKVITDLRRRKGDIRSVRELEMLDEFTTEDLLRLEPYLEF